jgi:N-acetylneuraminic acid mutarotase
MKALLFSSLIICFVFCGFSQTQNFWTKKADFGGLKRERAVAFSIDTMGFVATGVDTNETVLKDLWQYSATTDTWTQKADIPGSPRRDAVGFALNGKGYVGLGIDNDESFNGQKLKDLWEYDPATNTWLQKADFPGAMNTGLYFATAFELDNKGYVCGGKIGPNQYTNQLWEYKPSLNQWTQRINFPGGVRYQLCSFSVGMYGYVGAGANQDVFKKDFYRYNAGLNTWTQISDLPANERGSSCTFSIGGRGYVCMGTDGGLLDDLWEYNPATDVWLIRAPYGGSERKNAVAFVINGKAYVGTGKGYSGKKGSMHEYTPMLLLGNEELKGNLVSVYPNPAQDILHISWDQLSVSKIALYSFSGVLLKEESLQWDNTLALHTESLQRGAYILIMSDEKGQIVHKQPVLFN